MNIERLPNGGYVVSQAGSQLFSSAHLAECFRFIQNTFEVNDDCELLKRNNYLSGVWPKV